MRHVWLVLAITACGGDTTEDGPADTDPVVSTGTPLPDPTSLLALTDAHTYSALPTLSAPHIEVAAASDFTVQFDALTRDWTGQPFGVDDVFEVRLATWALTPAEIRDRLATDTLLFDDALGTWWVQPMGRTQVSSTDFIVTGHPFTATQFTAGQGWVLTFVDDDLRVRAALTLEPTGGNHVVTYDGSAALTAGAVLDGSQLVTSPSLGPWTLEWSALTTDVHGNPIDPMFLDRLLLARFASIDDAQAAATRIEADADTVYAKYVQGRTELSTDDLLASDGSAFEGFAAEQTWVVGFECPTCTSPVPQVLTRIVVVEE